MGEEKKEEWKNGRERRKNERKRRKTREGGDEKRGRNIGNISDHN